MSTDLCGACGQPAVSHPYGLIDLCHSCKRICGSYCWAKLQGIEHDHILPRYDRADDPGQAYLCILCGYWHWTVNPGPLPEDLKSAVWALAHYFDRVNFHINIARDFALIRHLPSEVS